MHNKAPSLAFICSVFATISTEAAKNRRPNPSRLTKKALTHPEQAVKARRKGPPRSGEFRTLHSAIVRNAQADIHTGLKREKAQFEG
jgi:hypothetical protein